MTYLSVIVKPVITEKSTAHNAHNKHVFEVKRDADKTTIKKAFEEIYKVKATDVRTHIIPKKTRLVRRGRELTKRPVTKRAIITVEKGKTIDPNKIK
jgi:large subunit ribosomal protein L23